MASNLSKISQQPGGRVLRRVRVLGATLGTVVAASLVLVLSAAVSNSRPAGAQVGFQNFVQFAEGLRGQDDFSRFGGSVAVSANGNTVIIGEPGFGTDRGRAQVFRFDGTAWKPVGGAVTSALPRAGVGFGVAISADGTRIAVSNDPSMSATVGTRTYRLVNGEWEQVGGAILGGEDDDLGHSLTMSADGTTIALAGQKHSVGSPQRFIRIFRLTGSAWVQTGGDFVTSGDNSFALSADGTDIVIANPARSYTFDGTSWVWRGADFDEDAKTVAMSAGGETIVVGNPQTDGGGDRPGEGRGNVRIYDWGGTSWTKRGADIDGAFSDSLGTSVDVSADGNTVLARSVHGVLVYDWNGSAWRTRSTEIATSSGALYSVELSADGDTVVIGAETRSRVDIFRRAIPSNPGADFNGDGFDDLVFADDHGSPLSRPGAGALQVISGMANGIDPLANRTVFTPGLSYERNSGFGYVWAAGDFNSDGFDDLAVSSVDPFDVGLVEVFDGSPSGLPETPSLAIQKGMAPQDAVNQFGRSLAVGDFNADGFDDLAVGAPGNDLGFASDAGVVHVFNGTHQGLDRANSRTIDQNVAPNDSAEANDGFGSSLAAADFNADGYDDLAVGVPGERVLGQDREGAVQAFRGSAAGVRLTQNVIFSEAGQAVPGEAEADDRFGETLSAHEQPITDANGLTLSIGYLIVGVPREDVGGLVDAGAVHYFPGNRGPSGFLIDIDGGTLVELNSPEAEGSAAPGDRLGLALLAGPIAGPNSQVGYVASLTDDTDNARDAGALHAVPLDGASVDLTLDAIITQADLAVPDDRESDFFGGARFRQNMLNMGDFNGDGFTDLHVIAYNEEVPNAAAPGISHVMYGSADRAPWDDPSQVIVVHHPAAAEPDPGALLCNGEVVTVNLALGDRPTAGDDVIRGTAEDDVIDAGGGNDIICALQGDDTITAGAGFDRVFAGSGNDQISGDGGNDLLIGGAGRDVIRGGNGNDRIQGGDGADELYGDNGLDRLAGGNGNDVLEGGRFVDQLFGNLGRDQLFGNEGNDVLRGGAWKDVMDGGPGTNDGCTLTDPGGLVETRINCESGVFGR